ncbi:ABC transporter related protein [Kribbella flavida DSM 17836]|uniref:ABC transporter related protein n=1 Tax=Kribbella flavida (strain DSM 17836 / JCM 10339 / NBRC 14399) TaxID=479435 RepID=D2PLY9_KRIFD|nr:ABC transporter ATP-binding protein [Kribbella flavida]ADB32569.1 ABC transporter related protein [Kribbella flavida DSM 17836]
MAAGPALVATGLRKAYGRVVAVESLDLEVAAGTVLGFLGPNGAGKTTAIRLLTTVLAADSGSFTVAGVPHTRPAQIRRRVGVLPESAGYPPAQSGEEWLRYHAELFGRDRADARGTARRLLSDVGLADRGSALISAYSRGMRQRLGIARALVNDPDVVFLDEPALGLDPMGQAQVLDLIGRIARDRGATVLLSTHVLADVEQVCDRVVILNRGKVVAEGTVAEVVRKAAAARNGRVRVPPEQVERALGALAGTEILATANGRGSLGELELSLPAGVEVETAATEAISSLLAAGVPVLGFSLEGGRLSDAFLAVTEEV